MPIKIDPTIHRCRKCGNEFRDPKAHQEICVPALRGLGTQEGLLRTLHDSTIGRSINGTVELSFRRGYSAGYSDGKSHKKRRY